MRLDKMAVNIRPLPAYQALDLGFAVARTWYVELLKLWLGVALSVWLPIVGLLLLGQWLWEWSFSSLAGWVSVLIWWLKPVFERPLLLFLSQKLFDEHFLADDTAKFAKSLPTSAILPMLTKHRLSIKRHTVFAVRLLEGQTGKALTQRIRTLSRKEGNVHLMHTVVLYHVEILLSFGVMALLVVMFSSQLASSQTLSAWQWLLTFPWALTLLLMLAGLLAMAVVAPFFVASGFVMYLCKRSLLEAWDVELIFRRLAHRHHSALQKSTLQHTERATHAAHDSNHVAYNNSHAMQNEPNNETINDEMKNDTLFAAHRSSQDTHTQDIRTQGGAT